MQKRVSRCFPWWRATRSARVGFSQHGGVGGIGVIAGDLGQLGWLYAVISTGFGLRLLWLNAKLVQDPSRIWARRSFLFSMQYLAGVFLAVVIDKHVPLSALFG